MKTIFTVLCLTISIFFGSVGVGFADQLWSALKSNNHFVMIRHALAPGFSDPDNFNLRDCKTQRNLSDEGRNQSKKIGNLFRLNGITEATVFSSQWCRCLDTANFLGLGKVSELPFLNSFFKQFEREKFQTEQTMNWIQNAPMNTPTVLVSHQVNISALTGHSLSSGEILFLRRSVDGSIAVIGSIQTLN